jgi:hypothetical protein
MHYGYLPGPGCSGSVVVPGLGGRNGDAAGGEAGRQLGQGPAQQVRHLLTKRTHYIEDNPQFYAN